MPLQRSRVDQKAQAGLVVRPRSSTEHTLYPRRLAVRSMPFSSFLRKYTGPEALNLLRAEAMQRANLLQAQRQRLQGDLVGRVMHFG